MWTAWTVFAANPKCHWSCTFVVVEIGSCGVFVPNLFCILLWDQCKSSNELLDSTDHRDDRATTTRRRIWTSQNGSQSSLTLTRWMSLGSGTEPSGTGAHQRLEANTTGSTAGTNNPTARDCQRVERSPSPWVMVAKQKMTTTRGSGSVRHLQPSRKSSDGEASEGCSNNDPKSDQTMDNIFHSIAEFYSIAMLMPVSKVLVPHIDLILNVLSQAMNQLIKACIKEVKCWIDRIPLNWYHWELIKGQRSRNHTHKWTGRKRHHATCVMMVMAMQLTTKPNEKCVNIVHFATDSKPVVIDNRCTACISHCTEDFVGKLSNLGAPWGVLQAQSSQTLRWGQWGGAG